MSQYIHKRVSYQCGSCSKQITLSKRTVDDSLNSGEVFCNEDCYAAWAKNNLAAQKPNSSTEPQLPQAGVKCQSPDSVAEQIIYRLEAYLHTLPGDEYTLPVHGEAFPEMKQIIVQVLNGDCT